MKRFILTKLFFSLRDNSKKGINVEANALGTDFEEFAGFLFSEAALFKDKALFVNVLLYTRVELAELENSEMLKRSVAAITCLQKAIRLIDQHIDWAKQQILAKGSIKHCPFDSQPSHRKKLKWTGTQADLVELVYSLLEAKVINNGNISLKELFFQLGELLNFRVTNYYRFFIDITHRVGDRTLFLDKLKKGLMRRMERSDGR